MNKLLRERVVDLFELTSDLALLLDEKQYQSKLGRLPSNTIGGQIHCIVGARESYLKQIQTGGSFEFTCSVTDQHNKLQVMKALHETSQNIVEYLDTHDLDERGQEIVLDIIQHETQHHGQLIRYVYGNKWQFPPSWNEAYTV